MTTGAPDQTSKYRASARAGRIELFACFVAGAAALTLLLSDGRVVRFGIEMVSRRLQRGLELAPATSTFVLSFLFYGLVVWGQTRSRARERSLISLALVVLMVGASIPIAIATHFWIGPTPFCIAAVSMVSVSEWVRLRRSSLRTLDGLKRLQQEGGHVEQVRKQSSRTDVVDAQSRALASLQEQFSNARRFWSDLLATFVNPVLVLDKQGIIQTWNLEASNFARRFELDFTGGLPIETLLAVFSFAEQGSPLEWLMAEPRPTGHEPSSPKKLTGVDRDGRGFELTFTQTRSAQGDPTGWILHMLDVTVRMSEIRERETAIKQREDALQFLSHDIRTPQLAILAILEHAEFQRAPTGLVHRIEQQARRTLNLAEGYVRLVQAEADTVAWEVLDLVHVVEDSIDAVWEHGQVANVKVRLEPCETEMIVLGNRGLLSRALVNLLENAIKFSPQGKAVICRLSRTQLGDRSAVACDVADQAGGIHPAQVATLFDRYASFRSSHVGAPGAGLGLALVQAVANRHGGAVTCESALGAGSVFRFILPCHDEHKASASPRLTPTPPR